MHLPLTRTSRAAAAAQPGDRPSPLPGRPYGAGPEQAASPRDASGHRDIKSVKEGYSWSGLPPGGAQTFGLQPLQAAQEASVSAPHCVRPEICAGARNPQAFAAVDRRPMMSDSALGGAIWSTSPCPPGRARDRFEAPNSDSLCALSAADTGQLADHEAPGGCDELADATESGLERGLPPGRLASRFWGIRSSPTSTPLLKPGARAGESPIQGPDAFPILGKRLRESRRAARAW